MADPAFSFPGMKIHQKKKTQSRSQHLNSLEKHILPVSLLETHEVVVKELPEIFEFELLVFL